MILTQIQVQIAKHMITGKTVADIAEVMSRSSSAIKFQITRIHQKCGTDGQNHDRRNNFVMSFANKALPQAIQEQIQGVFK